MNKNNVSREFNVLPLGAGLFVLLCGASVWASPLAQVNRNGLTVAVTEEKGAVVVQVAPASANHSTVFALKEPGRLVIDIPGKHFQRTEVVAVTGHQLVNSLRLGSHADKARIVVDLSGSDEPKFSVQDAAKGIRIVLGKEHAVGASAAVGHHEETTKVQPLPPKEDEPTMKAEPKAVATAKVAVPTVAPVIPTVIQMPTVIQIPTGTPTRQPTAAPTAIPTQVPVVQHKEPALQKAEPVGIENTKIVMKGNEPVGSALAEEEAKAPSTSGQSLQAIQFDKSPDDGQPIIRLKFSSRPRFLMTKSSERAYRLVVPDISLAGDQLGLPFFPPQEFKGFTVVRAETKAKDVEIMIGVERGGRITPTTKDNEVWIQLAPQ